MDIKEADVFIPECLEGTQEQTKTYKEFVEDFLIPALKSQNISINYAADDFPVTGNRSLMIQEAVGKCTYTIYCLHPVMLTEFYRKLLTPSKIKLIFLDIGITPERCMPWVGCDDQITIAFTDNSEVQKGLARIRHALDSKNCSDNSRRNNPISGPSQGYRRTTEVHGSRGGKVGNRRPAHVTRKPKIHRDGDVYDEAVSSHHIRNPVTNPSISSDSSTGSSLTYRLPPPGSMWQRQEPRRHKDHHTRQVEVEHSDEGSSDSDVHFANVASRDSRSVLYASDTHYRDSSSSDSSEAYRSNPGGRNPGTASSWGKLSNRDPARQPDIVGPPASSFHVSSKHRPRPQQQPRMDSSVRPRESSSTGTSSDITIANDNVTMRQKHPESSDSSAPGSVPTTPHVSCLEDLTGHDNRFRLIANNMAVLDEVENTNQYSADGKSPKEFLDLLKSNACPDETSSYQPPFICGCVIPQAVAGKDIAGLALLYGWSYHESVKRQALQELKKLLHHPSCMKKRKLWTNIVKMECILRPRQDDVKVKDKNIIMLYLEVYRLVISLLYIAILNGDVMREDIADILEHGQEANRVLKTVAKDLEDLNFDCEQVKSHWYIIGKFFSAVDTYSLNKPSKVCVTVKKLNHLIEGNLTLAQQKSTERDIQSSITSLSDKFHQHVIFHYLIILVCMKPVLQESLNQLAKMIIVKTSEPWSGFSLLYGYCNLCETCDNKEVITAVTAKDGYFRLTIQTFRKFADKLKIVTKILSALLLHTMPQVREVANRSLRRDKNGVFTQATVDSIADAYRLKIEMQGNPLGVMLEAEQADTGTLLNDRCILLKGKFNKKQRMYCKLPSPPCSIEEWQLGEMREGRTVKHDIKLLEHLQQKSNCNNIIKLLAYSKDVNPRLTYYLFSCNELDMSVSQYLVRCVNRGIEVPLAERVGLAVDVLNAISFCNQHNVLVRHIYAHAFFLTRHHGQVVAKLANIKHARIVTKYDGQTLSYYDNEHEAMPIAWLAPESQLKHEYTLKTEVYSASQTVHEILSHGIFSYQELGPMLPDKKGHQILKYRIYPERKPGEPDLMYTALLSSFLSAPEMRPTIEQLLDDFKMLRDDMLKRTQLPEPVNMSALKRMLKGQPDSPEMCLLLDMMHIVIHEDMWTRQDDAEVTYNDLCTGRLTLVACTALELQSRDDPEFIPGAVGNKFRSLMTKDNFPKEEQVQLRQLEHRNVAKVTEYVSKSNNKLYMVMDCKSSTTLLDHMLHKTDRTLGIDPRLWYYTQIAEGMAYLHESDFIHGCLQAKGIYITPFDEVVIGQLARATLVHCDVYDNDVSEVMMQPFKDPPGNMRRWLPKEANESLFVTQKADVYSLGTVVWELENALCQDFMTPYPNLAPYSHVSAEEIAVIQRQRHLLPQPKHCPPWLDTLIKALMANPSCRRPSFREIIQCLKNKQSSVPELASKRITTMIHSEDMQLGFLTRGTLRDQSERRRTMLLPVSTGKANNKKAIKQRLFSKWSSKLIKSRKQKRSMPTAAQAAEVSWPDIDAFAVTARARESDDIYDKTQEVYFEPGGELGSRSSARARGSGDIYEDLPVVYSDPGGELGSRSSARAREYKDLDRMTPQECLPVPPNQDQNVYLEPTLAAGYVDAVPQEQYSNLGPQLESKARARGSTVSGYEQTDDYNYTRDLSMFNEDYSYAGRLCQTIVEEDEELYNDVGK